MIFRTTKTERQIRTAAAFAEAGSDLEEGRHATDLFEGARWILNNSRLAVTAPELLEALKLLMDDYSECYQSNTDGQYGKTPGTVAWKRAKAVIRKARE
jgi:hypothetical protein